MLTELRISNFAVIERLALEFSSGFHVLTGETGAGKSILVDAISLLVGGRASIDQIRSDADEAVLEAAFALPVKSSTTVSLRECGLLGSDDTELVVRRVLSRTGRNRIYLNGALASLQQLAALAGTLVDIHGQHEQQSLLSAHAQLGALDAFGHLWDLRHQYSRQYEQWQQSRHELEEQSCRVADRERQQELLQYQYQELSQAELQAGEEESLAAERQRLLHGRRLAELADEAYEALYGHDHSVTGLMGSVGSHLRELSKIDASTGEWSALCETAGANVRELAERLRGYRDVLEQDPERLIAVEERWDRLQRLRKKYGATLEELLELMAQLRTKLDDLGQSGMHLTRLRAVVEQDHARMLELGRELSAQRSQTARKMESRIQTELGALKMERTRFRIQVTSHQDGAGWASSGCDKVEYLLSANAGTPLQQLAKVASGGELSRVMLATKTVLAESDDVPVLIFDEVDAGIGGAVAAVMGQRLRDLAKYHQVFCITHLPQIASQASHHYLVEKTVVRKRTVARVRALDEPARRDEIARMLAGTAITRAVRQTAEEMIANAGDP